MPLQRTPPQRVTPLPPPSPSVAEANTTLPSPSRAFRPINPGVRRTPPPGSAPLPLPDLLPANGRDTSMEVDDPRGSEAGPSTIPAPDYNTSIARDPAPVTPAPRIPRATKRTTIIPEEPAVPIPVGKGDVEDWGKRYEITLDTLELAIRAGALKWTATNLEQCFPLLAAQHGKAVEAVYLTAVQTMRTNILNGANSLLSHYKVGSALQLIDQVVGEARSNRSQTGRPDAWRPHVSPYAVIAATNLPIYDEAYNRLREECLQLHADSQARFSSIRAKQERLKEMEGAVSEGVVEVEKTIRLLEGFPSEEMMQWMEDTVGKLEGARAP